MTARKTRSTPERARQESRPTDRGIPGARIGKEVFPTEEDVDPEDEARDRRHPGALEDFDPSRANPLRPVEDSAFVRHPSPSSGTLSSLEDWDELPVVESGLPVEPEDLGRQFLSTATQQDNFESELDRHETGFEPGVHAIGLVISEATLEASGQEGAEFPDSSALERPSRADLDLEPPPAELDLLHDSVREASLFDRRLEEVELGETRLPSRIESDDTGPEPWDSEFLSDRDREVARTRQTLDRGRGGRPPYKAASSVAGSRTTNGAPEAPPSSRRAGAPSGRSRRETRHAAHVIQTSRRAAKIVSELTGLEDFDQAMTALEVVVSGIARRLTPQSAGDFLAQLPSELRRKIAETVPHGPEPGLTRETIESELSRRLDLDPSEAARIVSETGTAIEQLVSAGEILDVRAELPHDLGSIFSGEVAHRKP